MAINSVPAQLIFGQRNELVTHAVMLVKQLLCPNQGLNSCYCQHCRWIGNRQHPSLVWINPDGDYTLDDIEVVFDKIRFALADNEAFVFVLEQAHNLGQATANKLLKTLEEPPAGYHVILLSPNSSGILPTIKSRCVVTVLSSHEEAQSNNPLLSFFLVPTQQDPFAFEAELKRQQLNDVTSREIFEQLVFAVADQYKKAVVNEATKDIESITKLQQLLQRCLHKPPQSGSSDLFWKQLWLQWHQLKGNL